MDAVLERIAVALERIADIKTQQFEDACDQPAKKTRAKKATTEEKAEVDVEGNDLLAELGAVELVPTEEKTVVAKEKVIELFREVLSKDPTQAKYILTSLGAKTLKDITEDEYPNIHRMMVAFLAK